MQTFSNFESLSANSSVTIVGSKEPNLILSIPSILFKSSIKFIPFILLILAVFSGCSKKAADESRLKEVVVYTYDSFVSEWGAGPEIEKLFEEKTGLELTFVDCGDAVQVLSRAVLEKNDHM